MWFSSLRNRNPILVVQRDHHEGSLVSVRWRCAPDEAVILQFLRKNLTGWSNLSKGFRIHELDPHLVCDWVDVTILVSVRRESNAVNFDGCETLGGTLLWSERRNNGVLIVLISVLHIPDVQNLVFSKLLPIQSH